MSTTEINTHVLMSDAHNFDIVDLNSYSHDAPRIAVNKERAAADFAAIQAALDQAGITITQVASPPNCQDGIFTANWGLCYEDFVVLSQLPGPRKAEEPYAELVFSEMGKTIIKAPYRFSGQGDALPCGDYLFVGSGYRTDPKMHQFLAKKLNCTVIPLQTIPELDHHGRPVINKLSGWPDSFFYDIDLALAVIRPDLIAWCPEAFTPASQATIRQLPLDKIEVSLSEAVQGFACNLISTGKWVVMSANAPRLKADTEAHGLQVVTPEVTELPKAGGYIRCTTNTLSRPTPVLPSATQLSDTLLHPTNVRQLVKK